MQALVLGGGGREHAIVKALKASKKVELVSCAPGNPGIALDARTYLADPNNSLKIVELAKRIKPELVVIGPEAPLASGVSDALRANEFLVFGPSKMAARLETSKIFSKNFLNRHDIPTAKSEVCDSAESTQAAVEKMGFPCVVKADGLAAGKGVRIVQNAKDLKVCLKDYFEDCIFGDAAKKVIVEEFVEGEEVSVMLLVSGEKYSLLPFSRDHKKLLEKDLGPNTGGMGAYAPIKLKAPLMKAIESKVIKPTLKGLKKDSIPYCGVLYIGLIVKGTNLSVLEYNVRFGDPEAQVLLPLLDGDWYDVFTKVAQGKMPKLKWKKMAAVTVVLAAPGYPEAPVKGLKIFIDRKQYKSTDTNYLLHAGTATHGGFVTNGGRVLNVVGVDKSLAAARKKAYNLIKFIEFRDMQFRKDIANIK